MSVLNAVISVQSVISFSRHETKASVRSFIQHFMEHCIIIIATEKLTENKLKCAIMMQ